MGDNLTTASTNMAWWKGVEIKVFKKQKVNKKMEKKGKFKTLTVVTLLDCLENMVKKPGREEGKPTRMPVSGVYKIKGCGDVITGRIEQGCVKKEDRVIFLPTHTASTACQGKVVSIEMHHRNVDEAHPGDNVGLNVKNLEKLNMPRVGDIMVDEKEEYLKACESFVAKVSVLDHPGELKKGYTPIAFIRTGRAPVKIEKINWKITPKTGAAKLPNPPFVKANNMAEIEFVPQLPFVVDTFKSCEGLGRVAIMEGNSAVMLGTVESVVFKEDTGKKK
jgi:elongation factor 1-alpha